MMAEESSPGPGVLNDETIATLRLALLHFAEHSDDGNLRDALRLASAEARATGIPPEQVLTTLKALWYETPNLRGAAGPDHVRLLQRVVTMCIKEYYSG